MAQQSANAHQLNSFAHQHFEKVGENSLQLLNGDVITINADWFVAKAQPAEFVEGISTTSGSFPADNQTAEKRKVNYRPVIRQNTYKMDAVVWQFFNQSDVWYFFTLAIWADWRQ